MPDLWIDVQRGAAAPSITEQVYLQASGYAMIMLWYEPADDEEEEENDERIARELGETSKSAGIDRAPRYAMSISTQPLPSFRTSSTEPDGV